MPDKLRLHHIGVATKNIEAERPFFEALGYTPASAVFTDAGQKIRGQFMTAPGQPTLELLENMNENGPLDGPLRRGQKLYHLAYETDDMTADCERLTSRHGAKIIVPPTPADYFRRICFLMLPNLLLVELVQTLKDE